MVATGPLERRAGDNVTFQHSGRHPGIRDPLDVIAEALDEIKETWPEDDQHELAGLIDRLAELSGVRPPPLDWPTSDHDHLLRLVAPNYAKAVLAEHHHEFWDWVYRIQPGERPRPFVGIWFRGGAKTSSVELGLAMLGALRRRRYALIVTRTQNQGDKKIEDLAAILTSPEMAARYPDVARTKTLAVTSASGRTARRTAEWSRTRLRCENGFTVECIGLDVAARGIKVEDQRPDIIVFDDLDDEDDTIGRVQKTLSTIRRSIIPAGSHDVAIIYINNVVHEQSIAAHLAFPDDFPERDRLLLNRKLSGPVPAIYDLETRYDPVDAGDGEPGYRITKGTPAWPQWFGIEQAQAALNASNLHDFLREYQHVVDEDGGVFSHIEFEHADLDEVPWHNMVVVHVWVDPATSDSDKSDSMGVSCAGIDTDGKVWVLHSWEKIASPTVALKMAIQLAYEYGASVVGVETDTGGEAWRPVFNEAMRELKEDHEVPEDFEVFYDWAKAGQTGKSKVERIKMLITPFERKRVILVRGTHHVLEQGLRRFPKKPLDGIDAFWWTHTKLVEAGTKRHRATHTAARTLRPEWRPKVRR